MTQKKYIISGILIVLLVFAGGFGAGRAFEIRHSLTSGGESVDIVKVVNLYSKTRSSSVDFKQFWEVWDKVKTKYSGQPVDDVQLFYGAIQGMVAALDDPYSVYFPPKKAEEFAKDLSGEFEGIGAEIGKKDGILTVVAPLPGSPAEKAGLKTGDKIFAINGEETSATSVDEAIAKIRGKKGTSVILTVGRTGEDKVREISIVRNTINVPTVQWSMREDNIAYIRVMYFNEKTGVEFDAAAKDMVKKSPKGIILDMRSNPGGYLDTSVDVASQWIPQGALVVKETFNTGKNNEYRSIGPNRLVGIPTVVLVDEGTASGAEIVAGALQDARAAKVIGQKTFGKGVVQDFEVLPDGSALKLTVASWYTPDGRAINKEGIHPDIEIPLQTATSTPSGGETKDDVLNRGVEELLK